MIVARCEEIIIVSVSTGNLPPTQNQANPQNTADPTNGGQNQTTPGTAQDKSVLSSITGVSQ
jgi:hypothetical protein